MIRCVSASITTLDSRMKSAGAARMASAVLPASRIVHERPLHVAHLVDILLGEGAHLGALVDEELRVHHAVFHRQVHVEDARERRDPGAQLVARRR